MEDHEQVLVYGPMYIDVDMVNILECLWKMGLYTTYSCQNNLGNAYIAFKDTDTADKCKNLFKRFKIKVNKPYTFTDGSEETDVIRFNPDDLPKLEKCLSCMNHT